MVLPTLFSRSSSVASRASHRLRGQQLRIAAAASGQFLVSALFNDPAVFQHDDPVGFAHR